MDAVGRPGPRDSGGVARRQGRPQRCGDVSLGFEYDAGLGTARNLVSPAQQAQSLYAVLDAKLLGADVNFGVGRGLTGAADRLT